MCIIKSYLYIPLVSASLAAANREVMEIHTEGMNDALKVPLDADMQSAVALRKSASPSFHYVELYHAKPHLTGGIHYNLCLLL